LELIPIDKIRVSELNIRAEDVFGDEEDQEMVKNIGSIGILQPIIVRPVGDNIYEVYSGRRRFLAAKESGLTEISCIVKEVHDDEAIDISLIENIQRKDVDPVTLGRAIKRRLDSGIRPSDYAKRIGVPKQNLSDWLRTLDLSLAMQSEVQSGTVPLRDALKVVRMNLPPEVESALAEEARVEGVEAFRKALDQVTEGRETRGAPKGLLIVRINWGFESPEYDALKRFSESEGLDLSEYCQKILADHIQARTQA